MTTPSPPATWTKPSIASLFTTLYPAQHGLRRVAFEDDESPSYAPVEEVIHIPLVIRLPRGEHSGTTVVEPVSLVDVLPTLAALAALPQPGGIAGRSLVPFWQSDADRWPSTTWLPTPPNAHRSIGRAAASLATTSKMRCASTRRPPLRLRRPAP